MSSEMHVSVVPKEHVPSVWDKVVPFIEGAADYTNGRYATEDVYNLIMQYDYLLWIVFDDDGICGAAVTYFATYPRKRTLTVMFLGGDNGWAWKEALLATLNRWAADNECETIEASGRPGWARVLRSDGFTPLWQTFELPVTPNEVRA
jgi:hypothetical protein